MDLTSILINIFNRWVHPVDQPYNPAPPPNQPDGLLNQIPNNVTGTDGSYVETETDIHSIAGTSIGFGTQNITHVDDEDKASSLSQSQSYIFGSGKLVTKIEDVGGICRFCQSTATEQLQAGQISAQQAQLYSLYDVNSAAICNVCGTQGCIQHIRPVQTEDGVLAMCVTCQKQLKGQLLKRKIIGFLLTPFMEDSNE